MRMRMKPIIIVLGILFCIPLTSFGQIQPMSGKATPMKKEEKKARPCNIKSIKPKDTKPKNLKAGELVIIPIEDNLLEDDLNNLTITKCLLDALREPLSNKNNNQQLIDGPFYTDRMLSIMPDFPTSFSSGIQPRLYFNGPPPTRRKLEMGFYGRGPKTRPFMNPTLLDYEGPTVSQANLDNQAPGASNLPGSGTDAANQAISSTIGNFFDSGKAAWSAYIEKTFSTGGDPNLNNTFIPIVDKNFIDYCKDRRKRNDRKPYPNPDTIFDWRDCARVNGEMVCYNKDKNNKKRAVVIIGDDGDKLIKETINKDPNAKFYTYIGEDDEYHLAVVQKPFQAGFLIRIRPLQKNPEGLLMPNLFTDFISMVFSDDDGDGVPETKRMYTLKSDGSPDKEILNNEDIPFIPHDVIRKK